MVTDKTLLIKSVEKYANTIAGKFFGFKGVGSEMLINIAVNNIVDKYGHVLEFFVDKNGNIPNEKDLFTAFKNILNERDGIKVGNIKFTEDDVTAIQNIFKDLKDKHNGGI